MTASGIDIVLIINKQGEQPTCFPPPPPPSAAKREEPLGPEGTADQPAAQDWDKVVSHFHYELLCNAREIASLASSIAKFDSIQRELDKGADIGNPAMAVAAVPATDVEAHADPNAAGGVGSPDRRASTGTPPVSSYGAMSLVHDLTLGTAEFVDGPLSLQGDAAIHRQQQPSPQALQRGTNFISESTLVSRILGVPLRMPKHHADDLNAVDYPFTNEGSSRVILGRSAFAEKDRKGSHAVLYARQAGGQQLYFGPSAANVTLRNAEEALQSMPCNQLSHTVVV
jgi:hypothetical protein